LWNLKTPLSQAAFFISFVADTLNLRKKETAMSDQLVTPAPIQPPAPPAIPGDQKPNENMVPQSRLNEMAEKNRQLQERLDATEKERQDQLEKQLQEQGKWKELAEQRAQELATLKPKAEQVDTYEATLKKVLDAEIATLPEEYQDVVPEGLSTKDQLDWLAKNKSKFMKAEPFDIGAGKRGVKPEKKTELSEEEKDMARQYGMSEEKYAEYKK
jgi:seryl-tRNA synthetase